MPEHQRENLLTHISLLATNHAKQQAQINKQQDDLAEQKAINIKQYEEIRALRMQLNTVTMVSTPVLAMTKYQQHKTNNVRWYSRPVYTHHQGYKICLGVDAKKNVIVGMLNMYVYVFFMRGEFDDSLTWPFQGEISIQLLYQVNGEQNVKFEMNYDRSTMIKTCSRVTKGERGQLMDKYLHNDAALF